MNKSLKIGDIGRSTDSRNIYMIVGITEDLGYEVIAFNRRYAPLTSLTRIPSHFNYHPIIRYDT